MSFLSYKTKLRIWSVLHPIRTFKAWYFDRYIQPTDKWHEIVAKDPKKAFDMKWNRFYRRRFPWKNPRTLNEKITWMAVMTDTSKWTEYTDKYEVRKYIESLGLKDILTECYGVWDKAIDIDFDRLPEKFVLKCTHDSGGLVICRDKSKLQKSDLDDKIASRLKHNLYLVGREWPYKNDVPLIIAEQYLEDSTTRELCDYKFYCFNGDADVVMNCIERETGHPKFYFFDKNWNLRRLNKRGKEMASAEW